MVLSWVAFPLLALAVSFGCGLIVERAGGWRLPGIIVAGVGLAVVIVVAELTTESTALAPWTPWIVVAVTVIGYATSVPRLRELRLDRWQAVLGLVLFAVFAAPIVLSGHPTFSAYNIDGDPAFHLLATLELLAHGHRSLADLRYPTSTPVQLMSSYLQSDYPFGSDLAAGVLRALTGSDLAWVYSPFIAVVLTFGGLTLDELLRDIVRPRALRALCAFIAAQAGLAYSFYLLVSIKELTTTWALTLLVVLIVGVLRRPPSVRALAPLIVVTAAAIDVLAVPAVPWLVPPLAAFTVASLWRLRAQLRRPSRRALRAGAGTLLAIVLGVAIAWPILGQAVISYNATTSALGTGSSASAASQLGDLLSPLSSFQILGIWPNGDFRYPLTVHVTPVHVLLWLAVASALAGAAWTLYRRAWGPMLLMLGNGAIAWILIDRSAPYAASKVMAILSITAVLAIMLGAVALHDLVSPRLGWVLAAVLALAVLWTNDKSFRQAPLAPQPRFAALSQLDNRFSGQGPTFYSLWDADYPAYFLRKVDPTVTGIYQEPLLRPGTVFPAGNYEVQQAWDLNDLRLAYVESFKLLVLGRSPTAARPPANFQLVDQDRYYDVYRRESSIKILTHRSVTGGGVLHTDWPLSCPRIRRLGARAAKEHARLAYAPVISLASVRAADSVHPRSWLAFVHNNEPMAGGLKLSLYGGTLSSKITVPRSGTYTVWLGGAVNQPVRVQIGGRTVGTVSGQIGPGSMYATVGRIHLSAGTQSVTMVRAGASRFSPANENDSLGSLVLTRTANPPAVQSIAPSSARTLCGRKLQWVEIVRRATS